MSASPLQMSAQPFYNLSVGQYEVELSTLNVGTRYLDADGVAQLIALVMAASHKLIVALIELVVIAIEVVHAYKTLAMVLVNLAVDALGLYA